MPRSLYRPVTSADEPPAGLAGRPVCARPTIGKSTATETIAASLFMSVSVAGALRRDCLFRFLRPAAAQDAFHRAVPLVAGVFVDRPGRAVHRQADGPRPCEGRRI